MQIHITATRADQGRDAAKFATEGIQKAIKERGVARVILATGQSQFDFLSSLATNPIDWTRVEAFHLDEYVGLPATHPASFRKYLRERFVAKVKGLTNFNWVDGDAADPKAECARLGKLISKAPIDVACVGIGENAHLAFNDPPADFDTEEPFIIVKLDEACRRQQSGEGWFKTFADVPETAISMSIKQIMKSQAIVVTVPDLRKANAVKLVCEGPVTNTVPASILTKHANCGLYLDAPAASLLRRAHA